tara:strand:+ start:492 stop:1394 length:903 start_codon:yes stop_codon:yes gene_type:complete
VKSTQQKQMFSYFFGDSSNTKANADKTTQLELQDTSTTASQTTAETSGPKHILAHWQGDCSGSMQSMGNAPMDGGRNFCNEFRQLANSDVTTPVTISFYTFSAKGKLIYDGNASSMKDSQIEECAKAMTPSSTTNLYDTTVQQARKFLATINSSYNSLPDEVNKSTTINQAIRSTFMLFTDGEDNMSHEFTRQDLKNAFDELQKVGCAVVFAAANMDAMSVGASYGLDQKTCLQMGSDERTAACAMRAMTAATVQRSTQSTVTDEDELFSETARFKSCDPDEAAMYTKKVSIFPTRSGRM